MTVHARSAPPARLAANAAAAAIIALVFLGQGIRAPFTKDTEPQSAGWIRDVAENGHWLIARDDYGLINRKPPLYYWLSALAVRASGGKVNETNARAVSLVAGAALAAELMAWSGAHLGMAEGWLAFAFLLGSYGFAARATVALTDMLLSFLIFTAWCLLCPQIEGNGSYRRAVAAGVVLGLGILTKGPVALALPAIAALVYLLMEGRRPWALIREPWPWMTCTIAVATAACWYVPSMLKGSGLAHIQFVQENLGHFLPESLGGTGEDARPFYFIAARLFGGTMPFAILTPALVLAMIARSPKEDRDGPEREISKALRFQLALPLAVLILFSIASAKRDDYILPAIPGLAIAFAALFAVRSSIREAAARLSDWIGVAIGSGAAAFFLIAPMVRDLGVLQSHLQSSDAAYASIFFREMDSFRWCFLTFAAGLLTGAIVVFVGATRSRRIGNAPLWIGWGLAIIGVAGVSFFTRTLRPELAQERTLKSFAIQARREVGDAPIYLVGDINYELSFYYGRSVPLWRYDSGRVRSVTGGPVYVATPARAFARLSPATRARMNLVIRGNDRPDPEGAFSLYRLWPQQHALAGKESN